MFSDQTIPETGPRAVAMALDLPGICPTALMRIICRGPQSE